MEGPPPAMGPREILIAEYKAQMSDLMHAAMVTQANFQVAACRAEVAEQELAGAKARIAELEAKLVSEAMSSDNAAVEGDEAA